MLLAFVPLYIKYLGIEGYGLIAIFAVLQAWLGLLDMGMKPALSREMARFTGGAHDVQSIWNLLRSIEIIVVSMATLVAVALWAASGWLAKEWVRAEELSPSVVARAFALMGAVTALQFVESLYSSCIAGLQRQVLQNIVSSLIATVRGFGAVAILTWISPTISAFFVWQGLVSLLAVIGFAGVVYRILPSPEAAPRFSKIALIGIWRYTAGIASITLLALLLTQVDKLLLARLLPLSSFGHYALAGVMAGALYSLVGPITAAYSPRFTQLATRCENDTALHLNYHQAAQLVTVLTGAAAFVLMAFGDRILLLWTQDSALVGHVAPLLQVLALGTLLNGLMWIPYQLQLAHGWTSLTIKVNSVAVITLIPTILWAVPKYGAYGAAWVWVILNSGYIVFAIYFMHQRLLLAEKWRWYREDVAIPLAAAAAIAWLGRWFMPKGLNWLGELGVLLLVFSGVLLAAALAASKVRCQISRTLTSWVKALHTIPRH